jgi:hypothetical protein
MLTHKIGFSLPLSISVNLGDKKKDAAASKSTSKLTKIRAMEAKLMAMSQGEEFKLQIVKPGSASSASLHSKKPYDRPSKPPS